MRHQRFLVAILVAAASLLACPPATRAQMTDQQAIEAAREALRKKENFPWYDPKTDSLRRIDVQPPEHSARFRDSTWQAQPPKPPSGGWSFVLTLLKWLIYFVCGGILIFLIYLLYRAFVDRQPFAVDDRGPLDLDGQRTEQDLIENLPFDVKQPNTNLLAEARRLYEEGKYAEAIVYLFSYQLVQLDQHHMIRLTRGKTNRQYLREVGRRNRIHPILERTMIAFEDVFFGHYPLEKDRFEACWDKLDEFHDRLQQGMA